MEKLVVTPKQAAEMLDIGIEKIYPLLESGEIPAIRIGTRWKIPLESFKEYVIARAVAEAKERKGICYEGS